MALTDLLDLLMKFGSLEEREKFGKCGPTGCPQSAYLQRDLDFRLYPDLGKPGYYRIALEGAPMAREFSVIIERDAEGYYVASVPALRGCHTQARSLDDLMERVREAVELCLEAQGESVELLDFVGVQKITVA